MIADAENRNITLNEQNKRLIIFQEFINLLPKNTFDRSVSYGTDESFGENLIQFDESDETEKSLSFSRDTSSSFSANNSTNDLGSFASIKKSISDFFLNKLSTAISTSAQSLNFSQRNLSNIKFLF